MSVIQAVSSKSLFSLGLWNDDVCLVCWGRPIGWANRPQNNHQSLMTQPSVTAEGLVKNQRLRHKTNIKTKAYVCKGTKIPNWQSFSLGATIALSSKGFCPPFMKSMSDSTLPATLWWAVLPRRTIHYIQKQINSQLKSHHLLCNTGHKRVPMELCLHGCVTS